MFLLLFFLAFLILFFLFTPFFLLFLFFLCPFLPLLDLAFFLCAFLLLFLLLFFLAFLILFLLFTPLFCRCFPGSASRASRANPDSKLSTWFCSSEEPAARARRPRPMAKTSSSLFI